MERNIVANEVDLFLIYCLVICAVVSCVQCRFLQGSSWDDSYNFSITLIDDIYLIFQHHLQQHDIHLICMHASLYLTSSTPFVSAVLSSYR